MLPVFLFILAIIFTIWHLLHRKEKDTSSFATVFLSYVLFFNVGIMGILAAYAHVFLGPETARQIGWQPGSPFQFEIGMANLSYGVLGILAYWIRGRFWDAVLIGWSVLLLGCFIGHIREYYIHHNDAPFNIGIYVWFNDLILPFLVLGLLGYIRSERSSLDK